MGNFFNALFNNRDGQSEPFPAVVMGRGTPPTSGCLLIGKCTKKNRKGNFFVDGCRPDVKDIIEHVKDRKWG